MPEKFEQGLANLEFLTVLVEHPEASIRQKVSREVRREM
jgi:hypothetical protein